MVTFKDFSDLTNPGIEDIANLPNSTYPYFWAWILGAFWVIITSTLYFKEVSLLGKGKLISSAAISSFAIMLLSLIGNVGGFISHEIMIFSLSLGVTIMGIWIFSNSS